MKVEKFLNAINAEFFTGVPDSQLRALCDYLVDTYKSDPKRHIIAANEGNAAAIAAGYHLSTGKVPVVYMQNSGEGNVINPVASLLNDNVYALPCIFIVGWRGEPGVHDEPQHVYQGKVTLKLLEVMDIAYLVIDKETSIDEVKTTYKVFKELLKQGKQVAFVIKKGALTYDNKVEYKNDYRLNREQVLEHIIAVSQHDTVVSTTGKISRELFELREKLKQGHDSDFLTVGSMGHSSSIALSIALNKPNSHIWCIDGDGAALMHMGAMSIIGNINPTNLTHIVINNGAHESVGGMPTVASDIDFIGVAKACGYAKAISVNTFTALDKALASAKKSKKLTFIEVKCAIGSRADLGRPTTTALENKKHFMKHLKNL